MPKNYFFRRRRDNEIRSTTEVFFRRRACFKEMNLPVIAERPRRV